LANFRVTRHAALQRRPLGGWHNGACFHRVPQNEVAKADLVEDDAQLRARDYWQTIDHPEMGPSLA
jgi:hypothetical protein